MCQLEIEFDIGNYFNLTHWRGVADGGWDLEIMWILASTFNPTTKRVLLECLDVTHLLSSDTLLLEGLMDIELGGSWYNSPDIPGDPAIVDAFEYWEKQFPWEDFPVGTTLTARVWGAVPSGVSLSCMIYDVDGASVVATDPTPFTSDVFAVHEFAVPAATTNKTYRLQGAITGGSGLTVAFKGLLRPTLP
jgi:hypothetical protein